MKSSWSAPVVGLVMLMTLFAGCLSEGELDPAAVEAPVWEPGFRWTYSVDALGRHTVVSDEGRASSTFELSTGLNMSVTNTEGMVDGEPVYYVTQDSQMEDFFGIGGGLFGQGGVTALTQDDLQPVARSSYWGWRQSCGVVEMHPVDEPPILAFPLSTGKVWVGDTDGMELTTEVVGVEALETAAGTFDTVHLRTRAVPAEDDGSDMVQEDVPEPMEAYHDEEVVEEQEATQEYWYAPAVRNVIKSVVTNHAVIQDGDERITVDMTSTVVLEDYDLIPGEQQEAPVLVRQDPWSFRQERLQIVTDTAFPYNVANGTTTAAFGVHIARPTPSEAPPAPESYNHGPVAVDRVVLMGPEEGIKQVETVPEVADYDHDLYELHWEVHTAYGGEQRFVGDTITLDLNGPSLHMINAQLRQKPSPMDDCGYHRLMFIMPAWAEAVVLFEKEYTFSAEAGPEHVIPLDDLPVQGPAELLAHWTMESANPAVQDHAYPFLYTPDGATEEPYGDTGGQFQGWVDPEQGTEGWALAWRAQGPEVYGQPTPVAVGHDVVLNVLMRPA